MVVDCGGGTVDITVHQVTDEEGHCIKELHRAAGGPYGSIGNDRDWKYLEIISSFQHFGYKFVIFKVSIWHSNSCWMLYLGQIS